MLRPRAARRWPTRSSTELSHGVPDYARPLEGPFGKALRSGVEEALGGFTSMRGEPGRGPRRGARGVPEPRPRRDARGPEPRRPARGLPARRARGLATARGRGRARRPPAAHALRARRGDLRLHRRALGRLDRGLRPRAGGRGRDAPAQAPAPGRAAGAGAAGRSPPTVEAEAANAAWRLPRSLAALVVDAAEASGEQADRLALRLGPESLVAHVAPFIVALVPRRRAPRRARGGRARAAGPRWARRSPGRRPA